MVMCIRRNRIILRLVALPAVILALISLTACPIIVPPLVHYYKTRDAYVGTVTLNAKAEEVYSEIVSLAEKRVKEGKVKITNKAKQILYLEVTDGVQTAGVKVNKLSDKLSQMVITADIPPTEGESKEREKEREKELTAKIMRNICEGLNQNCQLVEQ
jgi:predicted AlkP superfamily phosphohydrolase/phosphomutase